MFSNEDNTYPHFYKYIYTFMHTYTYTHRHTNIFILSLGTHKQNNRLVFFFHFHSLLLVYLECKYRSVIRLMIDIGLVLFSARIWPIWFFCICRFHHFHMYKQRSRHVMYVSDYTSFKIVLLIFYYFGCVPVCACTRAHAHVCMPQHMCRGQLKTYGTQSFSSNVCRAEI